MKADPPLEPPPRPGRRRSLAPRLGLLLALAALFSGARLRAAEPDWRALVAQGKLVDVGRLDPTLRVELRYATARNLAGAPLYPADFPCLLRPAAAERLLAVQRLLKAQGLGLKIWDAYRPPAVQRELWRRVHNTRYVAKPDVGVGGWHCQGLAVDATLVDLRTGRELAMPTDFDAFSLDAVGIYRGPDAGVAAHLRLLQEAMKAGGFIALYREWWHYTVRDWRRLGPLR